MSDKIPGTRTTTWHPTYDYLPHPPKYGVPSWPLLEPTSTEEEVQHYFPPRTMDLPQLDVVTLINTMMIGFY